MANVVDLVESVEKMFESKPDKRKKTEHKEWKDTINALIDQLNKASKFKMYDKVK